MRSHEVETSDRRGRPKHRNSCSTVEEDLVAATSMDGSALSAIDALPSCHAISKHPRAAGYRGSDFVLWHFSDLTTRSPDICLLGSSRRVLAPEPLPSPTGDIDALPVASPLLSNSSALTRTRQVSLQIIPVRSRRPGQSAAVTNWRTGWNAPSGHEHSAALFHCPPSGE
jgi:hypothetical protein